MKDLHDKSDKFIPYGELMRGFSNLNLITNSELNTVLKMRGVFFTSVEKNNMIPALSSMILSPKEFDVMKDCLNTREDKQKRNSSSIEIQSEIDLLKIIPQFENQQLVSDNPGLKLLNAIRFSPVENDPKVLGCDFSIERNDFNKSWFEQTNNFSGRVEMRNNDGVINFSLTHTSSETKNIGEKIIKDIVTNLKLNGAIKSEVELNKITFGEFNNEDRIVFFNRLSTRLENDHFTFIDISDVQFRADESETLPDELNWLANKNEITMKGRDLHSTFFLKQREYHRFLQVWGYEVKFEYDCGGIKGKCIFSFGFPDFAAKKKDRAEFELNMVSNNPIENRLSSKKKAEIERILLNQMDKSKAIVYQNFKSYILSRDSKL